MKNHISNSYLLFLIIQSRLNFVTGEDSFYLRIAKLNKIYAFY